MWKRLSLQICLRFFIIFGLVLAGILLLFHFGLYSFKIYMIRRSIESAYSYFRTVNISALLEDPNLKEELEEEFFSENIHYILMDENFRPLLSDNDSDKINANGINLSDSIVGFTNDAKAVYVEGEFGEEVLLEGKLESAGKHYYIVIFQRTTIMRKYIRFTETVLFNVMLILWGLAAVLLIVIVRKSMKPMLVLSEELSAIIKGDYSKRIVEDMRYPEYVNTASRLNELGERLLAFQSEVENYRYLIRTRKIVDSEEIERRKATMAVVTHQLKTPLAIISSQFELEHDETDEIKKEYYYQSIMEEIDKLSLLISEILRNANKEGTSGFVFEPRRLSVTELLDEMAPKYENWLRSQEIRFVSSIDRNVYVEADPVQLEQVVHNYMMNACRHTKPGKTIRLRLVDEKERCIICVHNEGEGIPEANKDKLWKMYYQGEGEHSRREVGLGLYIVRDIMRQHGGEYGVTNDERGVEFYATFMKHLGER